MHTTHECSEEGEKMHLLSALLFAFSANIDNFTVGIAYGIRQIRIKAASNLLIALITSAGTFISMAMGLAISKILPPSIANAIGSFILILIGIWIMKDFFRKNGSRKTQAEDEPNDQSYMQILKHPEKADRNRSGTLDMKESLILALALTINNFGLGIGASITGLNIYITVIFTFLFSLISIVLGCIIGRSWLSQCLGKFAPLVSGLIIVFLGIYELIN